jgi:hypothetical protein
LVQEEEGEVQLDRALEQEDWVVMVVTMVVLVEVV